MHYAAERRPRGMSVYEIPPQPEVIRSPALDMIERGVGMLLPHAVRGSTMSSKIPLCWSEGFESDEPIPYSFSLWAHFSPEKRLTFSCTLPSDRQGEDRMWNCQIVEPSRHEDRDADYTMLTLKIAKTGQTAVSIAKYKGINNADHVGNWVNGRTYYDEDGPGRHQRAALLGHMSEIITMATVQLPYMQHEFLAAYGLAVPPDSFSRRAAPISRAMLLPMIAAVN